MEIICVHYCLFTGTARLDRHSDQLPRVRPANFFKKILEDNLKAVIKPQYVDQIPRVVKVSSCLLTVKPVSSDHIKQEIVLAFQTGGCLLLYESSFIQQ